MPDFNDLTVTRSNTRPKPNTPRERHRAVRALASQASDAAELTELLGMLGLTAKEGKA